MIRAVIAMPLGIYNTVIRLSIVSNFLYLSLAYFCSLLKLFNFDLRKGGKWFSSNTRRHRCYPFYTNMKRICLQRVYIGNIEPQSKAFPLCKSKVESKSNLPEGRENLYRIWRRLNSV